MNNKMKELLQEQTTVDPVDNSDSSNGVITPTPNWQREQLHNTPFWIVGNFEQGYNIILGKWKITPTEIFPETDHLTKPNLQMLGLQWLRTNDWNTILSIIICVTTDIEKQKQN